MPMFLDEGVMQEIIQETDGVLVEYRGQEAFFHCEAPTVEILTLFRERGVGVIGVPQILIGLTSCFPDLTRQTLITVDGLDWMVGDFLHPDDGETIFIGLTKSTRT